MNYSKFQPYLGEWGEKLKPFIESEACNKIYGFLKYESNRGKIICPHKENTFRAFSETPYNDLKCVWLLQDPYPWVKIKNDQLSFVADGIAMSCGNTGILQPSLEAFYNAMEDSLANGLKLDFERDPNLAYLCNQGSMMLNTALTVEMDKPMSHNEVWKPFTIFLFEEVFSQYNNGLIFILCGKASQYYEKFINPLQHYIFKLEHPAFAARKNREWYHNDIFKKINVILKDNKKREVTWMLQDAPF